MSRLQFIELNLQLSDQLPVRLEVNLNQTVNNLKHLASAALGVSAKKLKLLYRAKRLKDSDVLNSVYLQNGDTVHVIQKGRGLNQPHVAERNDRFSVRNMIGWKPEQGKMPFDVMKIVTKTNDFINYLEANGVVIKPEFRKRLMLFFNPVFIHSLINSIQNPREFMQLIEKDPALKSEYTRHPFAKKIFEDPDRIIEHTLDYMKNDLKHLECFLGLAPEEDRPTEMGPFYEMIKTFKRLLKGQSKYEDKMTKLNNQGFRDDDINFKILDEENGNLEAAISRLHELNATVDLAQEEIDREMGT